MTRLWPEGEQIEVWERDNVPVGFMWQGISHRILEICNHWRVHTRWWIPVEWVRREYWKVVTDRGFLCQICLEHPAGSEGRDPAGDRWLLVRLYD